MPIGEWMECMQEWIEHLSSPNVEISYKLSE